MEGISPTLCTVLVNVALVVITIVAAGVINNFGRKGLLFFS